MSHQQALRYGAPGSNKVTPANRVVYNASLDINEIETRVKKLNAGSSAFPGGSKEEVFKLVRWNPAMSLMEPHIDNDPQMDSEWKVLDCANGFGFANESRWELNLKLKAAGFIGIDGDYDEKANDDIQPNHIPIQIGGLCTVPITGPYRIEAGQTVMISAPDPRHPKPVRHLHNAPKEKIPWWLIPYNPRDQTLSKQAMYEILMQKIRNTSDYKSSKYSVSRNPNYKNLENAATEFSRSIRLFGIAAIISALEAGIIQPTLTSSGSIADFNSDEWTDTKNKWMSDSNEDSRKDFYITIAQAFGYAENGAKKARNVTIESRDANGTPESMVALFHELVFSKRINYTLFKKQTISGKAGYYGNSGTMNQNMRNSVEKILGSFTEFHYQTSRFFVGKAMSSGGPGDYIDIDNGSYAKTTQ